MAGLKLLIHLVVDVVFPKQKNLKLQPKNYILHKKRTWRSSTWVKNEMNGQIDIPGTSKLKQTGIGHFQ